MQNPVRPYKREDVFCFVSGEDLCNTMFGDAFTAIADEDKAFTMWYVSQYVTHDTTVFSYLHIITA